MKNKFFTGLTRLLLLITAVGAQDKLLTSRRWSAERANKWYATHKWISGSDFIPGTAINQLEMWQADTFEPAVIDHDLGYAEGVGFNTMRVFLHSMAWQQDADGFKRRINQYLDIAGKHHIQTIFVFFDDCWNADAKIGRQPEPKKGIHNSGWLQDPGNRFKNPTELPLLRQYVRDILTTFKHDDRILLWDLYNEPGGGDRTQRSLQLLTSIFTWARSVNPDQPLSVGIWDLSNEELNVFQIQNSDVITYHDYEVPEQHLRIIQLLKTHGRPIICTEYMARLRNSTFENTLTMLKKEHVGAINWGLVAGKTNTIYAWDTPMPSGEEPKVWFHDIFRKDGTPYSKAETDLIKKLNDQQ